MKESERETGDGPSPPGTILVAGIGNIFFGDDAFGCEVARVLSQQSLPEGVRVIDFGIRSYDLAYALMDEQEATILVDATARGAAPGTLYLIEPEINKLDEERGEVVNGHSMNPLRVLQMVRSLGGTPGRLYLVGCEPERLEGEAGEMALSATAQAAVPGAVAMILQLIQDLRGSGSASRLRAK